MSELGQFLERTKFTRAVVGYLVDGERVLLIKRIKVSGGLGHELIAGFGGKVGDQLEFANETADQAMDRETREEIGVDVLEKKKMGRVRFIFSQKDPDSKWNQDVTVYTVTKWNGDPQTTESAAPQWFDIKEVPWASMWADNKEWLPKVLKGEEVNAIFLFDGDNSIKEFKFEEINP